MEQKKKRVLATGRRRGETLFASGWKEKKKKKRVVGRSFFPSRGLERGIALSLFSPR